MFKTSGAPLNIFITVVVIGYIKKLSFKKTKANNLLEISFEESIKML